MIGRPDRDLSPSATRIAETVPAYGDGSSTIDFAVSISHDDVVDRDDVADLDLPGDDLGLGQALADVGELVLGHRSEPQRPVDGVEHPVEVGQALLLDPRGGYGVSKPPTRSTGASRE